MYMDGSQTKSAITQKEFARMERHLVRSEYSLPQKIALTCRILYQQGHDSGLSGQITARHGDRCFITQPLGRGFDEMSASDLLTVDSELNVISGSGMPNPANRFHSWIYSARTDVRCIIHTHAPHTAALSMLERPLIISHTDSCVLFDEVGFMPAWPGVPIGNEEGRMITRYLGNYKALLMAHHGLLTAASSVEEACVLAVQFERAAKIQLLAMAAGTIAPVVDAHGREARDWLLHPKRVDATFDYYSRRVLLLDPSCIQ